MRLLNSVCEVIATEFANIPIYIEEVPREFVRPSFFVNRVTATNSVLNINILNDKPTYQIVYFGERNEANQVDAEGLYLTEDKLKELFLMALTVPVIPLDGETKKRYAKITSYSSQTRMGEGACYCSIVLDFTEDIPKLDKTIYEPMESLDFSLDK